MLYVVSCVVMCVSCNGLCMLVCRAGTCVVVGIVSLVECALRTAGVVGQVALVAQSRSAPCLVVPTVVVVVVGVVFGCETGGSRGAVVVVSSVVV